MPIREKCRLCRGGGGYDRFAEEIDITRPEDECTKFKLGRHSPWMAERCASCGTSGRWWRIIWLNLRCMLRGGRVDWGFIPLRRVFVVDSHGPR